MRKTKIVCTIGPACRDMETLRQMVKAGMNVARLNFSHGDHEYHAGTVALLKQLREEMGVPLAIMLDTKGPEVRLRDFENGSAVLEDKQQFTLTTREVMGTAEVVQQTFAGLPAAVHPGNTILIDDGKIVLKVESTTDTDIVCRVIHGGKVSNHKGVNVPNVHLDMPVLGERDKQDLLFGIEQDVDLVAASFVRSRQDVIEIRKFLNYNGAHSTKIISKIENHEGIDNFEEILEASDGIMVARGDMGVEIEYAKLPGIQMRIIRQCYRAGKMVITATQMLDSMMQNPSPTRAEISDVANAVFDGTSAVMLSGETAAGSFPVESVKAMASISEQAEEDLAVFRPDQIEVFDHLPDITNAVCEAACTAAKDLNAKAIITVSKSGQTARNISKFRPTQPIVCATPEIKSFHQLSLSWGVYPVVARMQKDYDTLMLHAVDCAKQIDMVDKGDVAVIVAGVPLGFTGNTNLIKIEVID